MSTLFPGAGKGLPALIGVMAGIVLYRTRSGWEVPFWPICVFVVVAILLGIGWLQVQRRPRLAVLLIQPWGLAAISLMALGTEAVLWLTIQSPQWFETPNQPDVAKALSGALVGALTTYLAVLWTDDIKKADGPLLPATQFRLALKKRFAKRYPLTVKDGRIWEAVHAERVSGAGPEGWGWSARWDRAEILARYIRSNPGGTGPA